MPRRQPTDLGSFEVSRWKTGAGEVLVSVRYERNDLAEMFRKGVERKMAEKELFVMRSVETPGKSELYAKLIDYLDLDMRYYDMASHYYSGDLGTLEDGSDDDLLYLVGMSEPAPNLYAKYLRELPEADRKSEQTTHAILMSLKKAMKSEMEGR